MKTCGLPKGYEHKCCLNKNGWCTLGEAEYREIDTALEMHGCGFIRVNDRYLLWKHGVSYKDHNCGNCQYYKGETHGICTNGNVEPRAKGITENGEKKYIKCKEFWSGSSACEEFKKKEVEEVGKQKQITSCRTCVNSEIFKKVNHAGFFGNCRKNGGNYPIYIPDSKCKEYAPAAEATRNCEKTSANSCKEWECPFHSFGDDDDSPCDCLFDDENDGSDDVVDDIKKAVEEYGCQNATVTSAYEKLFPEDKCSTCDNEYEGGCVAPEGDMCSNYVEAGTCSTCEYSEDWGESVEWIKCAEGKKRKDVRKTDTCDNYYSCYSSLDDEPEGDLEEQMKEGDRQEQTYIYRGLV